MDKEIGIIRCKVSFPRASAEIMHYIIIGRLHEILASRFSMNPAKVWPPSFLLITL